MKICVNQHIHLPTATECVKKAVHNCMHEEVNMNIFKFGKCLISFITIVYFLVYLPKANNYKVLKMYVRDNN
jgi:hypothetical protein